jgi:hypothetical protein
MTGHIDPRPGWVRERIFELQTDGLSYDAAHKQAEAEADERFGPEESGP